MYDIIIVGAGPAGLTASIYAKRAMLNVLVLKNMYQVDSQISNTYEVNNYPGIPNVTGPELYEKFSSHAKSLDVLIKNEKVVEIDNIDSDVKIVKTNKDVYETKNIIIATGGSPKKGNFLNEEKFVGRGVSYCATCDGAFFKNKTVAVIGGGDVAVEDAIFLARGSKKVYVVVRRNEMRATKILQEELLSFENVEMVWNTVVDGIDGENKVEFMNVKNVETNETKKIEIDGIFVGIGMMPETELLKGKVNMDGDYIVADETCATNIKGIYAIGDVRKKQLRQVITACSDGANAITTILKNIC